MAVYHAPALMLVPALVVNLAVAAGAGWARRAATGEPAAKVPWLSLGAIALVMLAAGWALFPEGPRFWPVGLGVALGSVIGLVWHALLPHGDRDPMQLGPLGSGLAATALLALVVTDPNQMANAMIALLAGWGAMTLFARLATDGPVAPPAGLVVTAAAGAAAAWGEGLHPGANLGAPLAVTIGTLVAVGLTLASFFMRSASPDEAPVVAPAPGLSGLLGAFGVVALGSAAVAGGLYGQPGALVGALLLGAAAGLALPFTQPMAGWTTSFRALIALVVGGTLLVVDNRLGGILAIALGGVALGVGLAGRASARPIMTMLVAIFAARAWLQLFLDRTLLTGYGVDLTHPYAFAALVLGGLTPFAAMAVGRLARPNRALTAAWALAVTLAPAWVGYFIHVEALGALLAGLVLATFAMGVQPDAEREADSLAPTLLVAQVATTLLAAPWLVNVMNATRQERLVVLLIGLVLVAAWVGAWWAMVGRRQAAPAV